MSSFNGHEASLHDLVLCETHGHAGLLLTLHGIHCRLLVGISDVGQAERATTVLVSGELGCTYCQTSSRLYIAEYGLLIAVAASSTLPNSTTPVPRERPLGSYWISARSTLPIVVKSSTRSSLLVDQGSCDLLATRFAGVILNATHVADVDDRSGLATRGCEVGEGVGRSGCGRGTTVETTRRAAELLASETTATTELTAKAATTTHETSTATELLATETSTTTHEAATTTTEARRSGEAIFSDFEDTSVPVVSVKLLDGDLGIIGVVESDDTRALHATVRGDVNVSTDDVAGVSYIETLVHH